MHDNSTLNDPHECARRIVEALKALRVVAVERRRRRTPLPRESQVRTRHRFTEIRRYPTQPPHRDGAAAARRARQGAADTSVLVKVPPTLPPAGFGRGHTPIADALPHRYGRCDLAPLPVASATVADRTQTIPRRPLGPAATQPCRPGAVASLVKVRYAPDDETLVIALIEDMVRPAPGDATRPEDGFEPALFDCEGIAEHDRG